jgi:predicted GNAT family N-acyltransferase
VTQGALRFDIVTGSWAELGRGAAPLRAQVFVDELGLPPALERDLHDASAVHALARDGDGTVIATGRLVREGEGGRIGRLAVRRERRGGGVGARVLEALLAVAREQGCDEVRLQARIDAEPFYRRAGFVAIGPVYEEAGIAHVDMRRVL